MIDFFNNIGNWIVSNLDSIHAVLTSSNTAMIVSMIFVIFKNILSTNKNTLSLSEINKTILNSSESRTDITNIKTSATDIKNNVDMLQAQIKELQRDIRNVTFMATSKLNSIIEVQSIVYATIKDENIRNAVNSILVAAKYSDINTKAELEKRVQCLKEQLDVAVNAANAAVKETMEEVTNVISPLEESTELRRY